MMFYAGTFCGVSGMLLVGIDLQDSENAAHLSSKHKGLFSSIGIHPQNADKYLPSEVEELRRISKKYEKVVAVGETGFDLFHTPHTYKQQKDFFLAHMDIARDLSLPLIIHDREAHAQTTELMNEYRSYNLSGVFHCFSGDVSMARFVIDLGFYLSIPGVVTYKNAAKLKEVVSFCPLDVLLVETDAPFLAPVPYRGKRNEPSFLVKTINEISRIKAFSIEEVCSATSENFKRLFSIPEKDLIY
jgi:TatD DNase family protein